MRLLITGGTGLVGWRTARRALARGHQVTVTVHNRDHVPDGAASQPLDLAETATIEEAVRSSDPDAIVHSAAMTDVDDCELQPERALELNGRATRALCQAADEASIHLVHLSTSYVFGPGGPYEPGDPPGPVNHYGESKLAAERAVAEADTSSAILRTDQPYGWSEDWQSDTMVEWVLEELEGDAENVSIFTDWRNHPTALTDLVDAVISAAEGRRTGTYHTVGPDFVSRFEWARSIAKAFNHDSGRIMPGTSDDVDLPATRPNAELEPNGFHDLIDREPKTVSEGLGWMAEVSGI